MKRFKTYLKITVIFVNQVLFLLGLIVLVSSIILKDDIEDIEDLLDEQVYNLQNIPILLTQFSFKSLLGILTASMINGIVVIVVSFVGCYGVYYESISSLKFHLIFSSIATFLDFIVLLVLFVETRKMQSTIDEDICDLILKIDAMGYISIIVHSNV
ncbi:probable tetraspanin tspC [Centruroides sculpturatus]|uniref:probable tetraspanin tspC n=1 Tax=Centruroides sculpturatus TaxID=218467 RepID=UPI000C6EAB8A|nr:probable tetraspanin tspC [Centruroides sculpturatus]